MRPHIQRVLDGEYAHRYFNVFGNPVILDIGANIGAYTYWALEYYNPTTIYCYEPVLTNYQQLYDNLMAAQAPMERLVLVNKAVAATDNKKLKLFEGFNCGMHSITASMADPTKLAKSFEVDVMRPRDLPQADIVKVDTEGCEVDILTEYLETHKTPVLISYEFHSTADRLILEALMSKYGYIMFSGMVYAHNLGTFIFGKGTEGS